jgi:hypothetical protein
MKTAQDNWIYMQCAKWGRVTFGKEPLKTIFSATDRSLFRQLRDYCLREKMRMEADKTRTLFTFQLESKQSAQDIPLNSMD